MAWTIGNQEVDDYKEALKGSGCVKKTFGSTCKKPQAVLTAFLVTTDKAWTPFDNQEVGGLAQVQSLVIYPSVDIAN